ncbi:hypothetical protein Daus18300_012846 [Diaporthe australafricana]|uniref:Uncharacterized protein n=1 Tax=Diaporthe australafricana TaxID=127596 RepID=A0ABR3W1I7_9PEZI
MSSISKKDEIVLTRPKGYTGEHRRKSHDIGSGATKEYDVSNHKRSLSLAQVQFSNRRTEPADWMPEPLDGDYGSSAMQNLCAEFAELASELVNEGFPVGK